MKALKHPILIGGRGGGTNDRGASCLYCLCSVFRVICSMENELVLKFCKLATL